MASVGRKMSSKTMKGGQLTVDPTRSPEFEVALSFAGEQRDYVRQTASELVKRGIKVFYDENEEVQLWGKNLIEHFAEVYGRNTVVVVMFISDAYIEKAWPRLERRSALATAMKQRAEYVLPVKFGDAWLPEMPDSTGRLPADRNTPVQLAEKIIEKLVSLGGIIRPAPATFAPSGVGDGVELEVRVVDLGGSPVAGATVVAVAANGTTNHATAGADGLVRLAVGVRREVAILVAHEERGAFYLESWDVAASLEVILSEPAGVGSVAFHETTGYLPGFAPRLNPIGGNYAGRTPGRRYLYVTNGSVNDSPDQPFHFQIGQELVLADAQDVRIHVTCAAFVGHSTLWEFRR